MFLSAFWLIIIINHTCGDLTRPIIFKKKFETPRPIIFWDPQQHAITQNLVLYKLMVLRCGASSIQQSLLCLYTSSALVLYCRFWLSLHNYTWASGHGSGLASSGRQYNVIVHLQHTVSRERETISQKRRQADSSAWCVIACIPEITNNIPFSEKKRK